MQYKNKLEIKSRQGADFEMAADTDSFYVFFTTAESYQVSFGLVVLIGGNNHMGGGLADNKYFLHLIFMLKLCFTSAKRSGTQTRVRDNNDITSNIQPNHKE